MKLLGKSLPVISQGAGGSSTRGPHRLSHIGRCEVLWLLRDFGGYRAKTKRAAPLFGSLFHLCRAYKNAGRMETPPSWFDPFGLDDALREEAGGFSELIDEAKAMSTAYDYYERNDIGEPLYVEHEFAVPLGEIYTDAGSLSDEVVTCRVDLIEARRGTGSVYVEDYKTTAGRGKVLSAWNPETGEFVNDWQAAVNLRIVRASGVPVQGFAIRRCKRGPPFDFDRHVLRVPTALYDATPRLLFEAVRNEVDLVKRIERNERARPTGSMNGACYGRYGPCDYLRICGTDKKDLQSAILLNEFTGEADGRH